MMFQAWARATNRKTEVSRRCVPGSISCCKASMAANTRRPASAGQELAGVSARIQPTNNPWRLRARPRRMSAIGPGVGAALRGPRELTPQALSSWGYSYLDAAAVQGLSDEP